MAPAVRQLGLAVLELASQNDTFARSFEQQLPPDELREELAWQPRYAARVGTRGTYAAADDEDLTVTAQWFVVVVGVGHGCRPGTKRMEHMPDLLRARHSEVAKRQLRERG